MYYGIGTKENILADLHTQISKISGIQLVDWQRGLQLGPSPEEYPGVFINDFRIDKEKKLKDLYKNSYSVVLVGFVWAEESENLGTVLNTLIKKVQEAVTADPTRDSNAYDTSIVTIATDGGSKHPQGLFVMDLLILYFSEE